MIETMTKIAVLGIHYRGFSLHLGIRDPSVRVWGYEEDWYDGPLPMWGAGPVFLFCWLYSFSEAWRLP